MTDLEYDRELKHKFNDSTYYVRSLRLDRNLHVEVEQESTGYKWKNQFADSCLFHSLHTHIHAITHILYTTDIEEITSKTGNFKTFDKFCRMIYSALESNNSSVFIDLLTYQDLEILKARKATKSGQEPPSLNATHRTKNKRYLILTYVVEFDRVHYPLALKLDETSIDNQQQSKSRKPIKKSRSTQQHTARKLLSHSIASNSSNSSSTSSSITSSPQPIPQSFNQKQHKRCQSTPNLNDNEADDKMQVVMEENIKLKMLLNRQEKKQQYPEDKLTDIVEVLEDEIKVLKQELVKKNLENHRVTKNVKAFQSKNISKRLDGLEDEIERLSTELLSERTKCRRQSRQFHSEKLEFLKKIETLEASNDHYQRKCKNLRNDLKATKETLEKVRLKASKQRLYSTSSNNSKNASSASLRRSRSRNNSRYYLKDNRNKSRSKNKASSKHNLSGSSLYDRHRSRSNNKSRYQRSSSAPRFGKKNKARSRSPVVRFDPTAWAKEKKKKIAKSLAMKNTFGKSRSPSPFRVSRSVSPVSRASSKKRNRSKKQKRDRSKNSRDRSNSRRRNSFGTIVSNEPPKGRRNKSKRLPLYPSGGSSVCSNDTSFNESENDMNVLNTMEKRKERIFSAVSDRKSRSFGDVVAGDYKEEDDDDDDDDESSFNPTQEIESIDSRLNALQKFLRAAKSSA